MKTLIGLTLGLLLAASTAWAEPPEGEDGQGKRGDRMARMKKHLDLSDDQVSQMKEIRANGGGREEIRSVLNEDQREKMREHRKNRKGKGGDRQRPPQQEDEA